MGMLDRSARQIRASVVPDVSRLTLQNAVLQNVEHGTNVYTDQAPAYQRLNQTYLHEVVNHAETYVRGRVHTNGLENFWSLFKRNLAGTYVSLSRSIWSDTSMSKCSVTTIAAPKRIR